MLNKGRIERESILRRNFLVECRPSRKYPTEPKTCPVELTWVEVTCRRPIVGLVSVDPSLGHFMVDTMMITYIVAVRSTIHAGENTDSRTGGDVR